MPHLVPPRRRAVSTLFLVLLAVILMITWGVAQHFMSGSILKRVRIAEGARRALIRAETAAREAESYVAIHANEPPDDEGHYPPGSLAGALRTLEPGQLFEYVIEPELAREWPQGQGHDQDQESVPWARDDDTEIVLLAYLKAAVEEEAESEEEDCDVLLDKLRKFSVKWSQVPG